MSFLIHFFAGFSFGFPIRFSSGCPVCRFLGFDISAPFSLHSVSSLALGSLIFIAPLVFQSFLYLQYLLQSLIPGQFWCATPLYPQ